MFSATDHVYHSGNVVDMNKDGVLNGRLVADTDFIREKATLEKKKQNNPSVAVKVESAAAAVTRVLAQAGASLHRDAIDTRIIGYLKSLGKAGQIFKTEVDAGGQGAINVGTPIVDTDRDGIPDDWEKKHGLNSSNPNDASTISKSGYSKLEEYLNDFYGAACRL